MPSELRSLLWFERLYKRLGLPFWAGAPLVGFLPFFVSIYAFFALAGLLDIFLTSLIFVMPFFLALNMYAQVATRYVARRVEALVDYSGAIGHGTSRNQLLHSMYGLRGPVIVTILVLVVVLPLFSAFLNARVTLLQEILVGVFPWIYFGVFFGTFIWVLSFSMYTLYRIGKLPLKLKHFSEDRELGLRPFGSASLRLAGIYAVGVGLFVIPNALQGAVSSSFLALYLGLMLLALVLFLFPLLSLHYKLVAERKKILSGLALQYKELVQDAESKGMRNLDEKLTNQLTVTRQLLQDVQQIHSWPFDTGIVLQLSAIVFSVIVVLLSKVITNALGL